MREKTQREARRVSVVVPTYNRARSLERLLEALAASEPPPGGLEVVVVDDGSTDDTEQVARRFDVEYMRQANAGACIARQRGWQHAQGDIVIFTDDDCVPAPDAMRRLAAALDHADGVGAEVRPLATPDLITQFFELERLVGHGVADDGRIRWFVTAGVAYRRAALERVGGFDTTGKPRGAGDTEITLRLLESGARLTIEPKAIIYHEHRSRLGQLFSTYYRHGLQQRRLSGRHPQHRSDTLNSISKYFSGREWIRQYRRYRAQAAPARSLAFLALRAVVTVPYGVGVVRGEPARLVTHHPGGAPRRRRSMASDVKLAWEAVVTFRNWPSVLASVARERLGLASDSMVIKTRGGSVIHCRNDGLTRHPLYEVFADDEYGLRRLTGLRRDQPLNVVDIGAHIGAFTLAVCERFPLAKVTAYEPSPTACRLLQENISANRLSARVAAHCMAVTDDGAPRTLYEQTPASCEATTMAGLLTGRAAEIRVASIAFDEMMRAQTAPVDICKIDCEGAEHEIVRGSDPASWRSIRRLLIEHHPIAGEQWFELRKQLEALGFELSRYRGHGPEWGVAVFDRRQAEALVA